MKVEFLVSAVNQDVQALVEKMNLRAEAICIHQCDRNFYEEFSCRGQRIRCYHFAEKGVGLSRNNGLMRARGDLAVFADEDIVYEDSAPEKIREAFLAHPAADVLLFNVKVAESRRTYWNEKFHRVRRYNCGRYPAFCIALRTERAWEKNLTFSLLFGGGARFSNGEDSLFLRDCLRAGLKIYAVPVCIGEEIFRPSTWFCGYNDKFFYDRGVLYHFLYGRLALPLALRFLWRQRKAMQKEEGGPSWDRAWRCLQEGVRAARKGRLNGSV